MPAGRRQPIVPPSNADPQLIGTAFDYLLRFYVERLNPGAICSAWIAEKTVQQAEAALARGSSLPVQIGRCPNAHGKIVAVYGKDENPAGTLAKLRDALEAARADYHAYVAGGPLTHKLLISCCTLAKLDWAFRSGHGLPYDWCSPDGRELLELQELIGVVDPEIFTARTRCILNPRFRTDSILADADLLIDDRLIEIKVVSRHAQDQRDWDQLFGYYALHRIYGVEGVHRSTRIRRLGIYSARFATYQEIHLIGKQAEKAEELSRWIAGRLESSQPQIGHSWVRRLGTTHWRRDDFNQG